MRTIKFRGKLLLDGQLKSGWVYGTPLFDLMGDGSICIHERGSSRFYPVDPKTVAEFTSYHSDEGKEIYPGDIVDVFEEGKGRIYSGVIVESKHSFHDHPSSAGYRIVGNIYDNPDLLELEK